MAKSHRKFQAYPDSLLRADARREAVVIVIILTILASAAFVVLS